MPPRLIRRWNKHSVEQINFHLVLKGWVVFWWEETKAEGAPWARRESWGRNSFVGRDLKTEVRLGVKDVAKGKKTRICNRMRQGHIKQIMSLMQNDFGDFLVGEWKTIDRFIYSSQFFTVVIVCPQLSLNFYNENNAWKRDAGCLLGFVMLFNYLWNLGQEAFVCRLNFLINLGAVEVITKGHMNTIQQYCARGYPFIL